MGFVYDSVEPFSTRGIMELLLVFFFFFNGYFHVAFNDDQTKYFVPVFFFLHLRLVPWLDSSREKKKKNKPITGCLNFPWWYVTIITIVRRIGKKLKFQHLSSF